MSSIPVYVGVWTDWSHDQVLGSSMTVDEQFGRYILSGMATFIGIVTGFAWLIIAYCVHRAMISDKLIDAIHFQQQVVYRNDTAPLTCAADSFSIYLAWKSWSCFKRRKVQKDVSRLKRRTLHALSYPLLTWGAFTAAGVLSSQVARPAYQSSDVLVKPGLCGEWSFNLTTAQGQTLHDLKVLNDTLGGRAYARSCYSADLSSINPVSCSFYTTKQLPYDSTNLTGACPFALDQEFENGPCSVNNNTGSHKMYTILLDSHVHFGINAKTMDRVQLQKNVTCSPVSAQNNTMASNVTSISGQVTEYNLGQIPGVSTYTYIYNPSTVTDNVGYQISPVVASAGFSDGWNPIPTFSRNDSDVSLFFFTANSVLYHNSVSDPFFLAKYSVTEPTTSFDNSSVFYQPTDQVSIMGCVDQYRFCNPTSGACTIPSGQLALYDAIETLGLNVAQLVTAQRLIRIITNTDTYSSVYGSGPSALKASDKVLNFFSQGLPDNQWQIEVEGWIETSLAKMQAYTVEYAANTAITDPSESVGYPLANNTTIAEWEAQCSQQKITNTGQYQTFSFFGIMFTASVGTTIIVASLILKPIVSWRRKRNGGLGSSPYELAYIADGKFQLQRMALSSAGYGDWEGGDGDVPFRTKRKHVQLPVLSLDENGAVIYCQKEAESRRPIPTPDTSGINGVATATVSGNENGEAEGAALEHSEAAAQPHAGCETMTSSHITPPGMLENQHVAGQAQDGDAIRETKYVNLPRDVREEDAIREREEVNLPAEG